MVPFYGITSWLSLMYRESSIYFDVPRDCYEAWVIYTFLSLCMAYVGGPGAVVVKSDGKYIQPSWMLMTCCWPPIKVDGFLLRKCKQGTLQFVIIKPILAAMTLILFAGGLYEDGDWSFGGGFLYISIIYNVCYTIALYYLLIFYVGCEELLEPYRPLMKLILIKAVIFLTFWQSIAISMFAAKFNDPTDAGALQDWMVCLEMLMSACMMWAAFPHTEYKLGGQTSGWRLSAFLHAISLHDVYSDIMHQFNPNYKTYVLYSDGGPSENVKRKKFRAGAGKSVKKHRKRLSASGQGVAGSEGAKQKRAERLGSTASGRRPVMGADDEGEEWNPPPKTGILGRPGTGKGLFGWLPAISEAERKQAVLVDSESDAEYDDDNRHETAMDHEMLAASSGSESGEGHDMRGRRLSGSSHTSRSPSRRRSAAGQEGDLEQGGPRPRVSTTGLGAGQGGRRDAARVFKKLGSITRDVGLRTLDIGVAAVETLGFTELEDSDDDDRML